MQRTKVVEERSISWQASVVQADSLRLAVGYTAFLELFIWSVN